MAPRHPAERAFRCNMDRRRKSLVDDASDGTRPAQGQSDFRIRRAGDRAKAVRRDRDDCMTVVAKPALQRVKRANDAIDLRKPGVGDDDDSHASAGTGDNASALFSSDQLRISSRPS